jgi:hypothetical protein
MGKSKPRHPSDGHDPNKPGWQHTYASRGAMQAARRARERRIRERREERDIISCFDDALDYNEEWGL